MHHLVIDLLLQYLRLKNLLMVITFLAEKKLVNWSIQKMILMFKDLSNSFLNYIIFQKNLFYAIKDLMKFLYVC